MINYGVKYSDGFYSKSSRTRIFVNGNFEKLIKFKRTATMRGGMIEYYYGNIKYIPTSCTEDYFYRMSGSNIEITKYFYKTARPILGYAYVRKLSYRYLRRFYPEELL